MALLLHIDTALDTARIGLSNGSEVLATASNPKMTDHAAWLHAALQEMLNSQQISLQDVAALSVSIGPGSYTGLRIGLAAAKGICYALNKPLIAVPTLKLIARAAQNEATDLIAAMIDARRMEVYAAIYDKNLREVMPPAAVILDENSFQNFYSNQKLICCGNGAAKWRQLMHDPAVMFSGSIPTVGDLAFLAAELYDAKSFADLAYVEPLYIKDFYSPAAGNIAK